MTSMATEVFSKAELSIFCISAVFKMQLLPALASSTDCHKKVYSETSVHERLSSRTNQFTNKYSEQKTSRVTNGVSSNKHASRQQRLATSWEYRQESVSCCIIFTQYTSLLEFTVPSLEFHCVLWFFFINY
jgi:hypothetical protein